MSVLLLTLLGCPIPQDTAVPPVDDTGTPEADADGDGYRPSDGDCDDTDPARSPGASDVCDTTDNDCDGAVDEGTELAFYADLDGDGHGDPDGLTFACTAPAGAVEDNEDCDDADASTYPGAPETDCDDPVDRNCDGAVGRSDGDGDGWAACRDCDDARADVSPDAAEVCNTIDDDCDGSTDEDGADGEGTWFYDGDGDTYGNAAATATACDAPAGYVADATDCNDGSVLVSPVGAETCNGLDDDCDGEIDEEVGADWFIDADGDGYGDTSVTTIACTAPAGYVANESDCDDTDAATTEGPTWYYDADGDGYGTTAPVRTACTQPAGYAATPDDCDDAAADTSPGAPDVCDDGLDQDCSGTADDACAETVSHCGTISADETWEGRDVHLVTCDVYVQGSAAPLLTIEDGARVEFAPGADLYVGWGNYGELWIDGGTTGVTLTSSSTRPGPGDWGGLTFGEYDRGSWIEGAEVTYAGGNGYGALYAYYTPLLTVLGSTITDSSNSGVYVHIATADIAESTIADNEDDGVYLHYYAALGTASGFRDNTVSGNGRYPLVVPVPSIGRVTGTNTLSGNTDDAVYVYDGNIGSTTTIAALDIPWYIAGEVTTGASAGMTLTIADGAELQFAPGVGLTVGASNYADLVVDGATHGVTFTSADPTPRAGDWDGLYLGPYVQRAELTGATITYGGANGYANLTIYEADPTVEVVGATITDSSTNGVYVNWYGTLAMSGSVVRDNADYGVYVHEFGALDGDASFHGNTVTGNGVGMYLTAEEMGALEDDGTYAGNDTDDVTVGYSTITTDVTVRALDVPWHIVGDLSVNGAAHPTLTIEDGAELRFDPGAGIYVGTASYGALDVQGGSLGVTLTSASSTPAPGDWEGIYLSWYTEDTTLRGCDIGYAGGYGYGNVTFYSAGAGTTGAFTIADCDIHDGSQSGVYAHYADGIAISDTTVSDNADYGVYLNSNTGLETTGAPTFSGNTVTGNGLYPIVIPAASVAQLEETSTFSGNGTDVIGVLGGYVTTDGTWPAFDAPYQIDGDVLLEGSTNPVLTIDPGATLTFLPGSAIYVGTNSYGQLQAVGTPGDPIVFTSAQSAPHAGDWDGLLLGSLDTGSTLQDCEVSYGGASTGNVYIYANSYRVSVIDCTIASSATWGIYRYNALPTLSGITYSGNVAGTLY